MGIPPGTKHPANIVNIDITEQLPETHKRHPRSNKRPPFSFPYAAAAVVAAAPRRWCRTRQYDLVHDHRVRSSSTRPPSSIRGTITPLALHLQALSPSQRLTRWKTQWMTRLTLCD